MLTIGDRFPEFDLKAVVSTDPQEAFTRITDKSNDGKWKVVFFWPKDFTFVCPTEIVSFNQNLDEFEDRDCAVLTASTDSEYSHKGWCTSHDDLQGMKYPMLADPSHKLSEAYGVYDAEKGLAYRGIFLIDPNGIVRWMAVHDLGVGRNVDEVIRVLDALQTDKLCPCNWKPGEETLD